MKPFFKIMLSAIAFQQLKMYDFTFFHGKLTPITHCSLDFKYNCNKSGIDIKFLNII